MIHRMPESTRSVSPWPRRLLWYSGWLVWLPVSGYGISTGNLLLAFAIGPKLFLASLFFSMQKLVCPKCGQKIRTVNTTIFNCMKCGAAFTPSESKRDT
ncbi:50S ribosomal protein L37ae [Rhodopirellula baltica WH47]|uniref:50S ribosomal protein L37ae n=2 Tax=Rhodopirellula baltica TaxID=265606 RepID=F2AMK2_RHOBT|nr:50S ribosomal protein L37ae [Rhodopirellula baltica WH47]